MIENRRKVLDMLAEKKITVDEAERLLTAVDEPVADGRAGSLAPAGGKPKFLHVRVEPDPNGSSNGDDGQERVNVRVPVALIKAGMKLTALIPMVAAAGMSEALKEKGIDMDIANLKNEDVERLVDTLQDLEVDVSTGSQSVRVYVE